MHEIHLRVLAAITVLAGLGAMPADAAQPGFYVGFQYGDGSKEYQREFFDALSVNIYDALGFASSQRTTLSTRNDGEIYGFLGGYRVNQYLAFEGGYLSLGKQNYRETSSGEFIVDPASEPIPDQLTVSLTSRITGFAVSALAILPISYSWEIYGRAGVLLASNDLSLYLAGSTGAGTGDSTESSTDVLAGAGISMSLLEVYSLRAEFQRVFDAGDEAFGEGDIDLVSIGITVAF